MAGRNYDRLDIQTFGTHLLESGDLDPVYIALTKMEWPNEGQMSRWLIAYWCLYHCGAASYLSERPGPEFWKGLMAAAKNDEAAPAGGRWPRGHERRHFRGAAATTAVKKLWGKYLERPEQLVDDLMAPHQTLTGKMPFEVVSKRAQELPLFGPWISFKICDMLDRVLEFPVDFAEADVFMFTDPVKAALMLWREKMGFAEDVKPKDQGMVIREVVNHLRGVFKDHKAPPSRDRPVDLQEIETILCKWKSHRNGHYPLNNDIDEIASGLEPWAVVSDVALEMQHAMPKRLEA
jgi:hypothetical protein